MEWILFIPTIFIVSCFVISWVVLSNNNVYINPQDFVGKVGKAGTTIDDKELGIVYIECRQLMAKSYNGKIKRNWPVLIVAYDKKNKHYKVEKYS